MRLVEKELNLMMPVICQMLNWHFLSMLSTAPRVLLSLLWRWKSRLMEMNGCVKSHNQKWQDAWEPVLFALYQAAFWHSQFYAGQTDTLIFMVLYGFGKGSNCQTLATWRVQGWGWFLKDGVWYQTFSKLIFYYSQLFNIHSSTI